MSKLNFSFWKNKKVFITGHTGFKGSWLIMLLNHLESDIYGYSLEPNTKPSLFNLANLERNVNSNIGDIRDLKKISSQMKKFEPEILIHMAAQPLVRYSYINPIETYTTNVIGTANVLEAARGCNNLKSIVIVTSDKCYENYELSRSYNEEDRMGGHDPYSSSKGCCELLVASYRKSFFNENNSPSIATVRAGNVIAGGDWSEDRLIPDIIESFHQNREVIIRNPKAVRPWQHVLEPLTGYLILAQQLYEQGKKYAEGWNFGPYDSDCKSVEWVINKIADKWSDNVSWKSDPNVNPHEAKLLKLDCKKSEIKLKWKPKWNIDETLCRIVNWYDLYYKNLSVNEICLKEIKDYLYK